MVSHDIKLKEGPGRVGLSPRGLSLYRRNQLINVYDWSSVSEISFKSKKLTMTLKDEKVKECMCGGSHVHVHVLILVFVLYCVHACVCSPR